MTTFDTLTRLKQLTSSNTAQDVFHLLYDWLADTGNSFMLEAIRIALSKVSGSTVTNVIPSITVNKAQFNKGHVQGFPNSDVR